MLHTPHSLHIAKQLKINERTLINKTELFAIMSAPYRFFPFNLSSIGMRIVMIINMINYINCTTIVQLME